MPERLNVPQAVWPLSDRGLAARLVDLATLRFLEGAQPYARQAFFADVHSIDGLAPEAGVLARELTHDNGDCQRLFLGDGWSLHLVLVTRRPEVQVMVTATTADMADEVIGRVRRSVPPAQRSEGKARLTMWTVGSGGSPNRHRRWVDTPAWDAIADNYPAEVGAALSRLTSLPRPPNTAAACSCGTGNPERAKPPPSAHWATSGEDGPTFTSSSIRRRFSARPSTSCTW